MKEVCFVPTFDRSEFLYVCLEAIRAIEPNIELHCFPDRGTDETAICAKFDAIHHVTVQHSTHGNSMNMLQAYKELYQSNSRYDRFFVIEDDCIVDASFFSWCRNALKMWPDVFAAAGWRYSPDALISDGPDLRIPWFLSVCACLPRSSVFSIVQHARPEYYNSMKSYLDRAYPNSPKRGSMHYEQDGLILRVMESESKRCVWPRRPRATHCGFRGYHMSKDRLQGSLEERVAILKLVLKEPALLNKLMAGGKVPDLSKCSRCSRPLISAEKTGIIICASCYHSLIDRPQTSSTQYYVKSVI